MPQVCENVFKTTCNAQNGPAWRLSSFWWVSASSVGWGLYLSIFEHFTIFSNFVNFLIFSKIQLKLQGNDKGQQKLCPVAFTLRKTAPKNRICARTQTPEAAGAAAQIGDAIFAQIGDAILVQIGDAIFGKVVMHFSAKVVCVFQQK